MEGVMMRGASSMATAVRNPDGEVVIESSRFAPSKVGRVPIIRGVASFFKSLVMGVKLVNRSGEVFGDTDEPPTRFEKWLAKTFKIDVMDVVVVVGVILGVLLSLGLFVFVPHLAADGIFSLAEWPETGFGMAVVFNLITGFLRMAIFIGYIVAISSMKSIKRLFMYHGAEHKTIACYEHGLDLTVENTRTMTTVHDRCGTTFLFIVMVFSILFFSVFPVEILVDAGRVANFFLRIICRIVMIPLVAGISYEFLKLFAKYDNFFVRACKAPGLWLQKLTTREPDDDMIEVAITAFNEVLRLESDPSYPTKIFPVDKSVEKSVRNLYEIIKDKNEAELILMHLLHANTKTDLYNAGRVPGEVFEQAVKFAELRKKGAPLQYVLGETCFYGLTIKCDPRALIPRFDTEITAEAAIKEIKKMTDPEVLDLCAGTGAIAFAVKSKCSCRVTAVDVSEAAAELCKENERALNSEVEVLTGDLFAPVKGRKFDVIICNPPYVRSSEIASLDAEIRNYEPLIALDGGPDGLDYYRAVASCGVDYLNCGGRFVLEVGEGQAERVGAMFEGFDVEYVEDMNDPPIKRVVVARLLSESRPPAGTLSPARPSPAPEPSTGKVEDCV